MIDQLYVTDEIEQEYEAKQKSQLIKVTDLIDTLTPDNFNMQFLQEINKCIKELGGAKSKNLLATVKEIRKMCARAEINLLNKAYDESIEVADRYFKNRENSDEYTLYGNCEKKYAAAKKMKDKCLTLIEGLLPSNEIRAIEEEKVMVLYKTKRASKGLDKAINYDRQYAYDESGSNYYYAANIKFDTANVDGVRMDYSIPTLDTDKDKINKTEQKIQELDTKVQAIREKHPQYSEYIQAKQKYNEAEQTVKTCWHELSEAELALDDKYPSMELLQPKNWGRYKDVILDTAVPSRAKKLANDRLFNARYLPKKNAGYEDDCRMFADTEQYFHEKRMSCLDMIKNNIKCMKQYMGNVAEDIYSKLTLSM